MRAEKKLVDSRRGHKNPKAAAPAPKEPGFFERIKIRIHNALVGGLKKKHFDNMNAVKSWKLNPQMVVDVRPHRNRFATIPRAEDCLKCSFMPKTRRMMHMEGARRIFCQLFNTDGSADAICRAAGITGEALLPCAYCMAARKTGGPANAPRYKGAKRVLTA